MSLRSEGRTSPPKVGAMSRPRASAGLAEEGGVSVGW